MTLTPQWLDELRARTTLSALIGRSIKITKAGREYKACCPFHNEKTPSFTINDEKGFYHCFGCSAHGDAIRWMTDQRGLSFMDAVKELADQAGMDVPAPDPHAAKQADKRAGLHDVMNAAQNWFVEQLHGIEGASARDYLVKRGLKPAIIKQFGFGYAPDARGRLRNALTEFGDPLLIEAGLLINVEEKEPYDRFRGRLMIPIRDARGRVIAFGGRILGDGEPKYLNSPDTPLFDKGRTLYNLDNCSPASRNTGRVIVVEGYMDVIALAQAGFSDAVAPLGTAITEQQIGMLWRMTEKPLLCFDGDGAGQKAALRAALRALPLLKPGHSLQFVTLPDGKDPDDLLRASGPKAFNQLLSNAEPLVERLWKSELHAQPLSTPEDKASLKQRLGAHLSHIGDGEIRRHYSDAFRERLDALFTKRPQSNFVPRGKGNWQKQQHQPLTKEARSFNSRGSDLLAQAVIACLLRFPALISAHRETLSEYIPQDPNHAKLLTAMLDVNLGKETLDTEAILTILGDDLYNVAMLLLRADANLFVFSRAAEMEIADDLSHISKDLGEAIKLMKQRPTLENAFRRAEEKAATEFTDENIAELIRLKNEKIAFDGRVIELTRRDTDI